jgi:hypothetical protein
MSEGSGGKAVAAGGGVVAALAGAGKFADDGCRACGTAARHTDDIAVVSHLDDVGRAGIRGGGEGLSHVDDVARLRGAGAADELAHARLNGVVVGKGLAQGENAVEHVVKATPKELGFKSKVARTAERFRGTAPGPRPDHFPTGTRGHFVAVPDSAPSFESSFAEDFTRGVLESALDPGTVADLVDGFLTVQEIAEDADDGEMTDDDVEVEKTAAEMTKEIEAHLATLSPQARLAVERQLGPPEVIAYRIAEARPLRRGE